MRRYEQMTKEELLAELIDRGISVFDETDSVAAMIETLYQDDIYEDEFPESYHHQRPKKSEW